MLKTKTSKILKKNKNQNIDKNPSQSINQTQSITNDLSNQFKIEMFQHEKNLLKSQLNLMQRNVDTLMKQRQIDQMTIKELHKHSKAKTVNKRKSRKPITHYDMIAKRIAKEHLFPMIKFVSKRDLEHYTHKKSIGYHFLKKLRQEDQVKNSNVFEGKDDLLWLNAKDLVKDALSEKRNARQTQIKKSWKGLFSIKYFITYL